MVLTLLSKRNANTWSRSSNDPNFGSATLWGQEVVCSGTTPINAFLPIWGGSLTQNWGHGSARTKCCVSFGGECIWAYLK